MALAVSERSSRAPGVVPPDDMRKGLVPSTDRRRGHVPSSEPEGAVIASNEEEDIARFRKMLRDYVDLKSDEIKERRISWAYYHAKQWTAEEEKKLDDRGQPLITYNRVAKKINGVIGLLERLRQDPKAYPRTPAHEQGAEVATQCLRYVLDASQWESQLSEVALDLCVAGIGGWELSLERTDDGSRDPILTRQPSDTFFYDPRSLKHDFLDAHFKGVAKWMREDEAKTFLPQSADLIAASVETLANGTDVDAMTPDTDNLWWDAELKKLRVVEVWYRENGRWLYAIYTGTAILHHGESPFKDSKGASACRYIMQSANVDEKGNRYGFVRNLKGAQDEINHRRSRALHAFNTKQVIVEEGVVTDIEKLRAEAHRVDGVVTMGEGQSGKLKIQSNTDIALANVQMLQEAKEEIENFGPNPALIGQGLDNKSGRAIALLQQAAIAELGPFIVRVRAMKLRCYGQTWEAVRENWRTPRYIRLTDDEGLAGFLAVNQPRQDEFGQVVGVENPIGKVLVDFVLDEGPDTVTLREDAQQAIGQAMSAGGQAIPAPVMTQLSRALISSMNLPAGDKKRIMAAYDQLEQQAQQPDPVQQQAVQIELAQGAAKVKETEANTVLKLAQAGQAQQPQAIAQSELGPMPIEIAERAAKIDEAQANVRLREAQAFKAQREAEMAPLEFMQRVESEAARAEQAAAQQPTAQ
jgi:hypothetical protein